MKAFVFAICAIAAVSALRVPNAAYHKHWANFKAVHGKQYGDASEELMRRFTFDDNMFFIEQFNNGNSSVAGFRLAPNHFTDMTNEEYKQMLLKSGYRNNTAADSVFRATGLQDLPDTVDWRTAGIVTPVKNQGSCGSCWAFSTTGSLEGQHSKATGKLVSLSEQNLVDCSTTEGNQGCNGGLMDQAFDYIKKNGLDTEESYPYTGTDGQCKFDANAVGAHVTGYVDVTSGDENALKEAVATVGPISVAIDASSIFFQFYHSGVYNPWFCSSTSLDHGVLAVGYGTESGKDFWLVKNSWGESWGISGYIKMIRNKSNRCGIATSASYPTV